jgi:hypothetical protein
VFVAAAVTHNSAAAAAAAAADWVDALGEGKGFDLGDTDALLAKLDELVEAAPEPEEESD